MCKIGNRFENEIYVLIQSFSEQPSEQNNDLVQQ